MTIDKLFKNRRASLLKQILLAVFLVSLSIFFKVWIPVIGRGAPFLVFTTAVIISAWYGGLISGILTTFLSAAFAQVFFLGQNGIAVSDALGSLQVGIFVCEGLFLSLIISRFREAKERLSVSNSLLTKLFSHIKDAAIVVLNEKGQIVDLSESTIKLTGYSVSQTVGKHFSFLYTREERKQGIPKKELKYAFRQRMLQEKNWIVTKFGTKLFVVDETFPVINDKGETSLIVKIIKLLPSKNSEDIEKNQENQITTSFIPTVIHA